MAIGRMESIRISAGQRSDHAQRPRLIRGLCARIRRLKRKTGSKIAAAWNLLKLVQRGPVL